MTGTPSRRQLRRREAGWEGSLRQNPGPRNTNRMRRAPLGEVATMTEPKSHPEAVERRCGGHGGKVTRLTPGELPCPLWAQAAVSRSRSSRHAGR